MQSGEPPKTWDARRIAKASTQVLLVLAALATIVGVVIAVTEEGNPKPPPINTDGDPLVDADDKCPNQPGPPSNRGCPPSPPTDSDGDGVADPIDKCRDRVGPASNDGCPEPLPPSDPCMDVADLKAAGQGKDPGNDFASAQRVKLGQTYTESIQVEDDIDFYGLCVNEDTQLRAPVSVEASDDSCRLWPELQDETGEMLPGDEASPPVDRSERAFVQAQLDPGVYYLKVESSGCTSGEEYTVTFREAS